jgi:hypothetical protein
VLFVGYTVFHYAAFAVIGIAVTGSCTARGASW